MCSFQIKAKIHDFIFSNAKSVKGYQPTPLLPLLGSPHFLKSPIPQPYQLSSATVKLSSINNIPAGFFIFILHARYKKIHSRQCIIKMYNLHPSRIIQNSYKENVFQ